MKNHQGEKGSLHRLAIFVFPLVLAMLLASCGGGAGLSADAGSSLDSINSTGQSTGTSGGELLPLGTPLPSVPQDSGTVADSGSRSTSAVKTYNGSDFLVASGGTVDGTSLLLESSAEEAAWSLYKADGLQGQKVLSFALETRPQDLDTTYYVALGSFDDNRWHWVIETQLPEVNVEFSEGESQFISQLGNLYWVVLVDGGKSLYVDQATITTGERNGGGPGGGPGDPCFAIGPIDHIDDLSISVAGHYFIHNADTLWFDMAGNEVGPDAFAPGMFAAVDGYMADDPVIGGGCIALSVQMVDGNGGGGEMFTIDGPVIDITPEFFTVDGTAGFAPPMIFHDEATLFVNADGSPAVWSDIMPGDCVHAEGDITPDGQWLARFVVIENGGNGGGGGGGGGGGQTFVLDGEVTAIGPETISVSQGPAGAPSTVGHDDHTLFLLPDGMEGGWQDVAIGDFVHVDGQITPDGAMIADVVMDFGDNGGGGGGGGGGEYITVDGQFVSANENSFEVHGFNTDDAWTFKHDPQTAWLLPEGPGSWDDVEIGSHVTVDAVITDDNSLLALVVFVHGPPPPGM